jgi:hypothetical protein
MDTSFELWDVDAGNLIGTFETRDAALAIVRDLIRLNGSEYAESLELGSQPATGDFEVLGTGLELSRLAKMVAVE